MTNTAAPTETATYTATFECDMAHPEAWHRDPIAFDAGSFEIPQIDGEDDEEAWNAAIEALVAEGLDLANGGHIASTFDRIIIQDADGYDADEIDPYDYI